MYLKLLKFSYQFQHILDDYTDPPRLKCCLAGKGDPCDYKKTKMTPIYFCRTEKSM